MHLAVSLRERERERERKHRHIFEIYVTENRRLHGTPLLVRLTSQPDEEERTVLMCMKSAFVI